MRKSLIVACGTGLILLLASVAMTMAEDSQTQVILGTVESVEQDPGTGEFVINLANGSSYPVSTEARIYDNLDSWPVPYPGRITLIVNEDGIAMVTDIEPRDG